MRSFQLWQARLSASRISASPIRLPWQQVAQLLGNLQHIVRHNLEISSQAEEI
jgi:hypothetical protein